MQVRLGGPARPAGPTRSPAAVVCLLGAVLALGGCGPASSTTAQPAERTVTEIAPPPPVDDPTTEPAAAPSGPRPANGAVIVTRGASGRGELAIENDTGQDALLTLASAGKAVRAVYVRSSSTTDLRGIPDGTYDMFVALGAGWNRELRRFTASVAYSKFDETAPFQTVQESGGIRYTHLSITLEPVTSGSTSTSPVDADAYPS